MLLSENQTYVVFSLYYKHGEYQVETSVGKKSLRKYMRKEIEDFLDSWSEDFLEECNPEERKIYKKYIKNEYKSIKMSYNLLVALGRFL